MLLWRFSRFIYSILTTCGKKKKGPSNLREGCRQLFSGERCGLLLLVLTVANMNIYWTNSYKYCKLVLYKLLTRLSFLLQIFSKEKWKQLHSKHKYASSFVPCTLSWNSLQLSNHTTPVHTWLTQKMSGSITNTFYSCYHSNEIIFLISWRQNTRRRTRIELQRRGTQVARDRGRNHRPFVTSLTWYWKNVDHQTVAIQLQKNI